MKLENGLAMLDTERWLLTTRREAQQAAFPAMLSGEGELVGGHFRVRRLIGAGGMAQVYEAEDLELGRLVALKLPYPWTIDVLRHEGRMLARLEDPRVVVVHGWGQHVDLPFMILQHLPGVTLAERLLARERKARGPLGVDQSLTVASAVCDALAPLHARGIAHLDVKPSNLVFRERSLVLIDFGLACDEHAPPPRVAGSPHFMAPESIRNCLECDRAHLADLYAVGVILYACIAGRPPFADGDPSEVLRRQAEEEPAPLEGVRPPLQALISSLLSKDPARRPQSVSELHAALVGIPRERSSRR